MRSCIDMSGKSGGAGRLRRERGPPRSLRGLARCRRTWRWAFTWTCGQLVVLVQLVDDLGNSGPAARRRRGRGRHRRRPAVAAEPGLTVRGPLDLGRRSRAVRCAQERRYVGVEPSALAAATPGRRPASASRTNRARRTAGPRCTSPARRAKSCGEAQFPGPTALASSTEIARHPHFQRADVQADEGAMSIGFAWSSAGTGAEP